MLDFSRGRHDDYLSFDLVLSNLTIDVLLNLCEELIVLHELQIVIGASVADDTVLDVIVEHVNEGAEQDQNVWLVASHKCHQILQCIVT